MKFHIAGTFIFLIILFTQTLTATEWTYEVYPSEDELLEAYLRGDIDTTEYITLAELNNLEITGGESFLLDQIPNVTYFQPGGDSLASATELLQLEPFASSLKTNRSSGDIEYRFQMRPNEDDKSGYRFRTRYKFSKYVSTDFGLKRDLSGRERFTHRMVELKFDQFPVNKIIIGSFRHRIGLGSVIGFRGRMVKFDDELSRESLIYPDFGGFNGLLVRGQNGNLDYEFLTSKQRDDIHNMTTTAGDLFFEVGQLRAGIIFALTEVSNRSTNAALTDTKSALSLKYKYRHGYVASEATIQSGGFGSSGAIVIEGRHRFEPAEIRYSLWDYGDDFADYTSGSKSSNLRQYQYYNDIDYKISSRRTGQRGGMFRTVAVLADNLRLISSALYAEAGPVNSNTELSAAISLDLTNGWEGKIDLINKNRKRDISNNATASDVRKIASELKYRSLNTNIRTRFSINDDNKSQTYFSLLTDIKLNTKIAGEIRFWSNFSRIKNGMVEYWYGFVEQQRDLFDQLLLGIKLSHAYTKSQTVADRTTISVELRAFI